jgi:pimeloyl-ACP methyl ester carboxylesterase
MTIWQPEETSIRIPHLRLAARAWGPKNGVPVLALHGWLDNAASFDRLAPLLPGLRLIALDLPGHGFSEHRPQGVHYHFIDFIPDAIATADSMGWNRFALLGHSLGAGIASFVAAVIPERITQLALIEGLGPLSGQAADGPDVLRRSMRQMTALEQKNLPNYSSQEEAARARSRASRLSWEAASILAARGTKLTDTGISWRSDPQLTLTSPVYLTEEQVLAFLRHIRAPTLLICGESGPLIKRKSMAHRYECLLQLELKVLAGGHHLHLENPEPVARLLHHFLRP